MIIVLFVRYYNMKEKPEYFQVKEVIDLNLTNEGHFSCFKLKKINYNTVKAIEFIANKFKINPKQIGFAGNKDKQAITTQHISIPKDRINPKEYSFKDINLNFVGYINKKISLGDLKGNRFKIRLNKKLKNVPKFYENYFDEQRFGINHNNHILGKLIINKKFEELNKIIGTQSKYSYDLILRFYFHSYQSYLFNIVLAQYLSNYECIKTKYSLGEFIFIKKEIKNFKIPLINFDTRLKGKIGELYKRILKKENLTLDSFLIRSHPFLVSDTQERDAFVKVKNITQKKNYIYFYLPKGAYATMFIKKLLLL